MWWLVFLFPNLLSNSLSAAACSCVMGDVATIDRVLRAAEHGDHYAVPPGIHYLRSLKYIAYISNIVNTVHITYYIYMFETLHIYSIYFKHSKHHNYILYSHM